MERERDGVGEGPEAADLSPDMAAETPPPGAPTATPEEQAFFDRLAANAAEILSKLEQPESAAMPPELFGAPSYEPAAPEDGRRSLEDLRLALDEQDETLEGLIARLGELEGVVRSPEGASRLELLDESLSELREQFTSLEALQKARFRELESGQVELAMQGGAPADGARTPMDQAIRDTVDLLGAQQVAHEDLRRRYDKLEDALARLALQVEAMPDAEFPAEPGPAEPDPRLDELAFALEELRHAVGAHQLIHEELRGRLAWLEQAGGLPADRGGGAPALAEAELREEIGDARSVLQRVSERVMVMEVEADERERGLLATRGAFERAEQKLVDQEAWLEDLLENLELLRAELEREQGASGGRDDRLREHEDTLVRMQLAHDELGLELQALRERVAEVGEIVAVPSEDVENLAQRLLALEETIAALAPSQGDLLASLDELNQARSEREAAEEERRTELEARLIGLEQVTDGLHDRLQGRANEGDRAHTMLAEQVKQLGTEALRRVHELEKRGEQASAGLSGAQAGLEALTQRLEARMVESTDRLGRVQQELQAMRAASETRFSDLYEERNRTTQRLDRLETLISEAMQSLTVSQSELQAARFELSNGVSTLEKGHGVLMARLGEFERAVEAQASKMSEVGTDLSSVNGSVRRAQDQLSAHGQRLGELGEGVAMVASDQKAALQGMEHRIEQFGGRMREGLEAARQQLQEQMGPRLELMDAQQDQLRDHQARLVDLEPRLHAVRGDVDAIAKAVADLTKQGSAFPQLLRAAQQTAATELADTTRRLEDQWHGQMKTTRDRIASLEARADEAILSLREQVELALGTMRDSVQKLETLTEDLEAKTSKAMVYQHMQIDWAVNEVNQLRKDKEALQAEAQAARERAGRVETVMQEMLQRHQAEIATLKDDQLKLAARVSSLLRIVSQVMPKGT